MITVKLTGGLGNQMFQYALGKRLAIANNTKLCLDLENLLGRVSLDFGKMKLNTTGHVFYEYELLHLNIDAKMTFLSRLSLNCAVFSNAVYVMNILKNKLHQKIRANNYVIEKMPQEFDAGVLGLSGNLYLSGYWQREDYFKEIEDVIRKDFKFKLGDDAVNEKLAGEMRAVNSVSLHIRRGDYVYLGLDKICDIAYYERAISYIKEKVPNPVYYVFSNDIEWVRNNLKIEDRVEYISHNKGEKSYLDMYLMSQCKHNVIANSSFSWWAAWLNENDSKIIVAPTQWFGNNAVAHIAPSAWIRL